MRLGRASVLLLTVGATLLLASCGEDDSDEGSIEVLSIEATEVDSRTALEMPSSAPAGVTEIELVNSGKRPHEAQLIRVEGDRSPREVFEVLENAQRGFPDWFRLAGGPATTEPRESTSVTQELEPGAYFAVDTESFDPSSATEFEVTGETGGGLPEAEASVSTFEYDFEAEGLKAGVNEVLFQNTGSQPHHVRAVPLLPGKTLADVREFVETERGQPPVDLDREVSTSVIEGGMSQVVELELEAGKYAMLCFITDRQGGPPHVAKGMIAQVVVGE